jgi:hypothetical protein
MIEILECSETEKAAEPDTTKLDAALADIMEQYTMDRQNEGIHIKTKNPSPRKRQEAMDFLYIFAHIKGLQPESFNKLQHLLDSVRKGNSALINEIVKARTSFVESKDIANWMRYIHADKNTGENGIVTLALQCTEGDGNG